MKRAGRVSVLVLSTALALASGAAAQPSPRDGDTAIAVGQKGMDLFRAGKWAEAFEQFSAADRMAHSPVFVLFMARSRREQGDLLAARELYRRITSESVPEGAPEPWTRARADAETEIAALAGRIPTVRVKLSGRDAASATLSVDGVAVARDAASSPIELNPGDHSIEARAGASVAKRSVTLAAGGAPLDVELVLAVAPAPAASATAAASAGVSPAPPRSKGSIVPGVAALGVGAAALGVGIATGVVSKNKANHVLDRCSGDHCLASDADAASTAESLATVSTVSFVLAGVAVPVGVVLLLWRPGGESQSGLVLAPRWAGAEVRGRF